MRPDRVEYRFPSGGKHVGAIAMDSSIVPPVGAAVSIKGQDYVVALVSYCVDYADSLKDRQHCACVRLAHPTTLESGGERDE